MLLWCIKRVTGYSGDKQGNGVTNKSLCDQIKVKDGQQEMQPT